MAAILTAESARDAEFEEKCYAEKASLSTACRRSALSFWKHLGSFRFFRRWFGLSLPLESRTIVIQAMVLYFASCVTNWLDLGWSANDGK